MSDIKYDTIIVGAGQSGLAMAYYLNKLNEKFLILEADNEVGESWLKRWDSLKLFTPSQFNNLPGFDFPSIKNHYPNKLEVAKYLKNYCKKFSFNIQLNSNVESISKKEGDFIVSVNDSEIKCKKVVIATGPFHIPFVPEFAKDISNDVVQLHSKEYKNLSQLKKGATCVVGAGDSGVQIASELSTVDSDVIVSASNNSNFSLPQEFLGQTLWWWFKVSGMFTISVNSFLGKFLSNSMQPVIGTNIKQLFAKTNVSRTSRACGFSNNMLHFDNNCSAEVKNIIWATGYKPDYSFFKFDCQFDSKGYPLHKRGVSKVKGLYFIGLPWMFTRESATLGGVRKDAKYLYKQFSG
jgi:putative flavoprotein involved in K+ transport